MIKTAVGYTAGQAKNPTYDAVCSGRTGHTEAVQMTYDPQEVCCAIEATKNMINGVHFSY